MNDMNLKPGVFRRKPTLKVTTGYTELLEKPLSEKEKALVEVMQLDGFTAPLYVESIKNLATGENGPGGLFFTFDGRYTRDNGIIQIGIYTDSEYKVVSYKGRAGAAVLNEDIKLNTPEAVCYYIRKLFEEVK